MMENEFHEEESTVESNPINVREILLINKRTGFPILSRVYSESSGKDPILIAGLLSAILQFAETIGGKIELNDIGIQKGARVFVRGQSSLVCVLIIEKFSLKQAESQIYLDTINEITSRVFEIIYMMFSTPSEETIAPVDILPEYSTDSGLDQHFLDLDQTKIKSYPEIGGIIDNIILEATMVLNVEDTQTETEIEEVLVSMEQTDTTYLSSSYSGVSKKISQNDKYRFGNLISRLKAWTSESGIEGRDHDLEEPNSIDVESRNRNIIKSLFSQLNSKVEEK